MVPVILLAVVIVLLVLIDLYFLKSVTKSKIPGPQVLPFVGNGFLFLGDSTKFLNTISALVRDYGDRLRIYIMNSLFVILTNPKDIETVLSSTELITKSEVYDYLHPWLGQGLLTATGYRWRSHRKFLTPAFHFNILRTFLPIFQKNDEILVKKLYTLADGKPINLFPIIAPLALDNVSESAMGVSVNAQTNSESEYVQAVNEISEITYTRMRHAILRYNTLFNLSSRKQKQDKALSVLHGFTKSVIKNRREVIAKSNITLENYENDIGIKKKSAFLDLLLLSEIDGVKLDIDSVREEVDTFMFEGHDTTTSGITFALYSIANNSEVQEKLYQEQLHIFGNDNNRHATYQELGNMKYLENVIKEALRLYPSVPMIGRMVTQDIKLGEFEIKKGTNLVISPFHMQRHPDIFEDPLAFRPERFENNEMRDKSPYSWVSFSAGPRNCIGQRFAMMEIKQVLSSVVRHFKLLPSDIVPILCSDLILRSQNGVYIKLLPRT